MRRATAYSNSCSQVVLVRFFVYLTKSSRHLIETLRLLEMRRLFLSCTNAKIQVPVSQGNYVMVIVSK